jgi:hypothetical protein
MPLLSLVVNREHLAASICMLLTFVSFTIMYPLNMVYFERAGWIWDYPARNLAMEHMLLVNYAVLGVFFLYGARAPHRYLPLIDFTIVFNILHGAMMMIDALAYPHHESHLRLGGDVPATYLVPILLILSHPKRFYLPLKARDRNSTTRSI